MKNKITLDIDHSEKKRVEHFLNKVDRKLEQIPFDAKELNHVDEIIGGFKFKEKGQSTFVTVIFATSYFHANEIRAENSLTSPDIQWTINGDILFGVDSTDKRATSQMLSFFAGEE
jgi:hypothetical protein